MFLCNSLFVFSILQNTFVRYFSFQINCDFLSHVIYAIYLVKVMSVLLLAQDLLLLSINASLFPEYCRIENYIHVVMSATLHLQLKIKTFQKCTIKNKEVEIMEDWCLSGYDGRCQWSLS